MRGLAGRFATTHKHYQACTQPAAAVLSSYNVRVSEGRMGKKVGK